MEKKKLYRVPSKGMIGGICVGLGEYLDLDPTIVRLIFVLLTFAGLSGVLIYIIMWLIIPVKPVETSSMSESEEME
jgi:phage shock protein C